MVYLLQEYNIFLIEFMDDLLEEQRINEDFQFVVGITLGKANDVSRVEFRKCEFKHFSTVDNSHYKTESLSKMK